MNRGAITHLLAISSVIAVSSEAFGQPLPDCGPLRACAQQMIELVNKMSEENKLLGRRILELEKEKDRQAETNKALRAATMPEAISKAALSALEFVVRHDNSASAFNEATCEDGEKLVGGSCVGASPNYNPPAPHVRLGDGGQTAVGPLFANEKNTIAKLTMATKVVCRAYGDPGMQVTAYAVCARPIKPVVK